VGRSVAIPSARFKRIGALLREFHAPGCRPFIAMLVDVTGLIIYFSVAFMIMRGTML